MEWRVGIYGSMSPSRTRRATINTALGSTLFAVYGAWTDFVPSALIANVGVYLAAVVSLSLGLFISHGYATGRFPWHGNPGLLARLLCYAGILVGIYCAAWLIIVRAAPDVATRIFGTYDSQSMVLEASYQSRRRSCDHQLQSADLAFPGHICVPATDFGRFAPRGEVILSGKSTMLGMHVSLVEPGTRGQ